MEEVAYISRVQYLSETLTFMSPIMCQCVCLFRFLLTLFFIKFTVTYIILQIKLNFISKTNITDLCQWAP